MYKDGILVDESATESTAAYDPQGYDTLELGRANNRVNMDPTYHGEAYIDDLYLCETMLQESDIMHLYLSYLR